MLYSIGGAMRSKLPEVAKTPDPMDELVRQNLKKFREEAGLNQSDAAELSGVAIDNLRRYESGKTVNVPATVVAALCRVYGHSMDDVFLAHPPPAKLEEAPAVFLRTRPGVEVPRELMEKLQADVDKVNRQVKPRRIGKK